MNSHHVDDEDGCLYRVNSVARKDVIVRLFAYIIFLLLLIH